MRYKLGEMVNVKIGVHEVDVNTGVQNTGYAVFRNTRWLVPVCAYSFHRCRINGVKETRQLPIQGTKWDVIDHEYLVTINGGYEVWVLEDILAGWEKESELTE